MLHSIYNPAAGNGMGEKIGKQTEKLLQEKQIPFHTSATEYAGHATDIARQAVENGTDTVVSIGGDGTALEIARGLAGSQTALGIIPAGTGNDFRKTLGLDSDPEKALETILTKQPQPTDAGRINGQLFLNEIGTGFDVAVLDYANKAKKHCRGLLPYLWGVICALFRFKPIRAQIQIDDQPMEEKEVFVIAAANGGIIGGGIVIAPDAKADDGLMDIVIVDRIKRYKLPLRLIGLLRGKILTFPETHFVRGEKITFSAPHMRLNVDGEIIAAEKAEAEIIPGALLIHR